MSDSIEVTLHFFYFIIIIFFLTKDSLNSIGQFFRCCCCCFILRISGYSLRYIWWWCETNKLLAASHTSCISFHINNIQSCCECVYRVVMDIRNHWRSYSYSLLMIDMKFISRFPHSFSVWSSHSFSPFFLFVFHTFRLPFVWQSPFRR